jgi:hypothetical protein
MIESVRIVANGLRHDLHRTASENDTNSLPITAIHLQLAHNEDRDNTECPIEDTTQCRISIERVDDDTGWNTMSFTTTVVPRTVKLASIGK